MNTDQCRDAAPPGGRGRRLSWPAAVLLICALSLLAWLIIGAITWWFLR